MAVYRGGLRHRRPSRRKPEEGFTLVEVLIAMGVIFTALLVMAFTMLSAFKSVGFSRQRTQATALANQALEQIRALPADALFLSTTDSSTDSQLTAGCLTARSCTFGSSPARVVPVANFGATQPTNSPLVPHVTTVTATPGTTTYTIKSYITIDPTDTTGQTRVATVQVTWDQPQQGGVSPSVQVESKLHTAPFTETAPGTHSYDATAYSSPGQILVSGSVLNKSGINQLFNLPVANAYLNGGTPGTNVGGGATGSQVAGGTAGAGISAAGVPLVQTIQAIATAQTLAGSSTIDGPRSATGNPVILPSLNGQLTGGLGLVTGTLSGQVAAGSVTEGDAVADSQAKGQAGVPGGQTLPNNSLGFGQASATQTGVISAGLTLSSIPSIPLVSATPSGSASPDLATVAESVSGSSQSYTASADKYFQQIDVLPTGLPLLSPAVRLTSFHAKASACAAGTGGSCPPSTATQGGTVTILGLTTIDLATRGPGTIGIPSTTANLGLATLVVGGTVTIGSATTTGLGSASVASPVQIDATLKVTGLGLNLADLTIHVDLGTVTTTANYS